MGNRIYYAVEQVGIRPASSGNGPFVAIHGIQSVGTSTHFNIEPVSDFGTIPINNILENSIDNGISLIKVLDGYPLIYLSATSDSSTPLLADRIMQRCAIALSVYDDNLTWFATNSGIAISQYTGLYISSMKYKFDTVGPFEEEITFEGSNKIWNIDTNIISPQDMLQQTYKTGTYSGQFNNMDSPHPKISMRWNIIMPNTGINGIDVSHFPIEVSGQHVTSITTSVTINRTHIESFGDKGLYFRMPNFPVEVTTEFTVIPTGFDKVSVSDIGILTTISGGCYDAGNTSGQFISIATCDGLRLSLGYNNYLTNTNWQGADTHGSNVKVGYIYRNYDDFIMTAPTGDIFYTDRQQWLQPVPYETLQPNDWGTMVEDTWGLLQV